MQEKIMTPDGAIILVDQYENLIVLGDKMVGGKTEVTILFKNKSKDPVEIVKLFSSIAMRECLQTSKVKLPILFRLIRDSIDMAEKFIKEHYKNLA
jgi:hypothetical protein